MLFRQHLGKDQDDNGERGRYGSESGVAEHARGQSTDDDGAQGIGHRVQRQDGRNGLFQAEFQALELFPRVEVATFFSDSISATVVLRISASEREQTKDTLTVRNNGGQKQGHKREA
jgi:hypothetical protein